MTARRRQPEAQLQRAVLDHLAWRAVPGAWWCHYPAGGWRSPIEAAILKSLGTIAETVTGFTAVTTDGVIIGKFSTLKAAAASFGEARR